MARSSHHSIMNFSGVHDHYILRAKCDNKMTGIYVDGILKMRDTAAKNEEKTINISECFWTVQIWCQYSDANTRGILASVEDEDGNVILKTDSSWKCRRNEKPYDITKSQDYDGDGSAGKISGTAQWIRTSASSVGDTVYCTGLYHNKKGDKYESIDNF